MNKFLIIFFSMNEVLLSDKIGFLFGSFFLKFNNVLVIYLCVDDFNCFLGFGLDRFVER